MDIESSRLQYEMNQSNKRFQELYADLPNIITENTKDIDARALYCVTAVEELEAQINKFKKDVKQSLQEGGLNYVPHQVNEDDDDDNLSKK